MHVLAVGVIVMLAKMGAVPGLVAVKAEILPVPMAARPMAVLLLTHENVVPAPTGLVITVTAAPAALQYVWSETGSTVGVGLMVMV